MRLEAIRGGGGRAGEGRLLPVFRREQSGRDRSTGGFAWGPLRGAAFREERVDCRVGERGREPRTWQAVKCPEKRAMKSTPVRGLPGGGGRV